MNEPYPSRLFICSYLLSNEQMNTYICIAKILKGVGENEAKTNIEMTVKQQKKLTEVNKTYRRLK
jgi:hypothetical protein